MRLARRARLAGLVLLWLLAIVATAGPASSEAEVYNVENRPAAELLPVVTSALGEGASATVDAATNSIVMVGPESSLASARTLLEQLDVARASVLVRVESRSSRALRGAGYHVEWAGSPESIAVGRLIGAESGAAVPPPANTAARGRTLSTARDDRVSTSLRILDGEVGQIETGRSVPIVDRRLFGSTTSIVEVSTGLLATPRVLGGDRVQLELAPYEGDVSPAARTRFMRAATTVTLRAGEVVVVGTLERSGSASGQDAFARRSQKETVEDTVLLVSVEIE